MTKRLRILPFGDSITQNNSALDNGVWQQGAGYAEQAIYKAGKYTIIGNAGIGGNTVAQMLARVDADVIAQKPEIVLLMAGTNSILTGMVAADYASLFNDLEKIVLKLLAANILPVIVTPPAKANTVTGWAEVREAIRFYYRLADHYDLPLIDMFKVTVDPATGAIRSGYAADGTHPSGTGLVAMSDYAGYVLAHLNDFIAPPYLSAVADAAVNQGHNLLQNGTFDLNTVANNPDYWNPNLSTGATMTSSAAAVPGMTGGAKGTVGDFNGRNAVYKVTTASGRYALSGAPVSVGASAFQAGDVLVFSGRALVSGMAATANGFTVGLDFDGGAHARPLNGVKQNGDFLFSEELTVPLTPGALAATAYVQDIGTYQFNNFTLWNKTKSDAIWAPGKQGDVATAGSGLKHVASMVNNSTAIECTSGQPEVVDMLAIDFDPEGLVDLSDSSITIPESGEYFVLAKMRLTDTANNDHPTAPGLSYGFGPSEGTTFDDETFSWFTSNGAATGRIGRNFAQNGNLKHYNAGDKVKLFAYADGDNIYAFTAKLSLFLVKADA